MIAEFSRSAAEQVHSCSLLKNAQRLPNLTLVIVGAVPRNLRPHYREILQGLGKLNRFRDDCK